jgi:hypothetical protein
MKKALSFLGTSSLFVSGAFMLLSLVACGAGTGTKAKTGDIHGRYPVGLIEDNLNDAAIVLHVVVKGVTLDAAKSLRSDSGKIGYAALVFRCHVVEVYKGDLAPGGVTSFVSFWEYHKKLLEEQIEANRHRIVFLNKGREGSYHALSFGVFDYTEELDEAIKNLVGQGG